MMTFRRAPYYFAAGMVIGGAMLIVRWLWG